MQSSLYVGIDPGVTGAIAALDGDTGVIEIFDMPTVATGRRRASELNLPELARIIDSISGGDNRIVRAALERAQPMPKQGVVSVFTYGETYGAIRAMLASYFIPYSTVRPADWKKSLEVPREKDAARARASELLPRGAAYWPLKKHHNRAEAALLALYAKEGGGNV